MPAKIVKKVLWCMLPDEIGLISFYNSTGAFWVWVNKALSNDYLTELT